MPMKNPPHPGRIVRQDCVEPLGLTITEAAKALGVTRQALNNLVNGKAGISPEMAVRISKAFGGGAEMWLRLQANYDLRGFDRTRSRLSGIGALREGWFAVVTPFFNDYRKNRYLRSATSGFHHCGSTSYGAMVRPLWSTYICFPRSPATVRPSLNDQRVHNLNWRTFLPFLSM
jgi:addiction module HigA family antidote